MIVSYKTQTRTNPLLLAQRWAQDPNKPKPGKVEMLPFRLFEIGVPDTNKTTPMVSGSFNGGELVYENFTRTF